jgi:hypothetical protein
MIMTFIIYYGGANLSMTETIIAAVVAGIILGILSWFVARIPAVSDWFLKRPWAVASAVAFVTSAITGAGIWVALKPDPAPSGLPKGAVVAFDLPNGCPSGWVVVDSAIGRAIVGATTYSGYPRGGSADVYGTGYADGVYGTGTQPSGTKTVPPPGNFSADVFPSRTGNKTKLGTEYSYLPLTFGTIDSAPPAVLALWYCKRGAE